METDIRTFTTKDNSHQNRGNKINSVLITGIAGTGGSYMAEYIVANRPDIQVHGIARWRSSPQNNLSAVQEKIQVYEADLSDFGAVLSVLQEVKPDVIIHLAAHANVRVSFINPSSVLNNNIIGTSNLFEAVRMASLDPLILLCSTSEVYGQVDPKDVPIKESAPLRPASPYAVSKAAQDMLGSVYFTAYNLRIIRTRMFAYLNPRRTDLFATSFAKQVAWIERGLQKEVVHGNLDSVRTLIDINDAMDAYWKAVLYCQPGEVYNIGGATTMTVGEFLQRLIALCEVPIPTRTDPNLLRPSDVTLQIPSVEKFVQVTGWTPLVPFEESLLDLLSYWRREADIAIKSTQMN
ncbi:GDP-mannose 4,6-dehydratase [Chloroflexota bacterium]